MNFKEYVNACNALLKKRPECGEFYCFTSSDGETAEPLFNGFCGPSVDLVTDNHEIPIFACDEHGVELDIERTYDYKTKYGFSFAVILNC